MKNHCATTPLLLQAIRFYKIGFGLIPPLFVELELGQNQAVKLRYYGIGVKIHQKLWSFGLIIFAIAFINFSNFLLIKTLLHPNKSILNVVEIVIFFMCIISATLVFALLKLIYENQQEIPLLNDFFLHGFHIGKIIIIKPTNK